MLLGGQRCDGNRAGSRRSPLAQSPPPSPPALKNMRSTRPADPQRTGNSGDVGPEELQLLSTCLESGQNGAQTRLSALVPAGVTPASLSTLHVTCK